MKITDYTLSILKCRYKLYVRSILKIIRFFRFLKSFENATWLLLTINDSCVYINNFLYSIVNFDIDVTYNED